MLSNRGRLLILASLFSASLVHGQSIPEDEIRLVTLPYSLPAPTTLRAQTNLVLVPVVVRDAKGQPVAGLTQGDFRVYDKGKQQTISAFSVEMSASRPPQAATTASTGAVPPLSPTVPQRIEPRPRFIALYFDDWNSPMGDIAWARMAAEKYVREGLQPNDRVAVFTTSGNITLEFTRDTEKLLRAIGRLLPQVRSPDAGPGVCSTLNPYLAYLVAELNDPRARGVAMSLCRQTRQQSDFILALAKHFSGETLAVIAGVVEHLAAMPGERILVLTSSGFFTRFYQLQKDQQKIVEAALRNQIVINSLDATGLAAYVPGGDASVSMLTPRPDLMFYIDSLRAENKEVGKEPLALLAAETGGRFFQDNNDLARGYRELAGTPETRYVLGFSPADVQYDGSFHSLKVRISSRPGLNMKARRGYYAPTPADLARQKMRERFDSLVRSNDPVGGLLIDVTAEPAKNGSGEPVVNLALRLDLRALRFERVADRRVARLRCVFAFLAPQGNYVSGAEALIELRLKPKTLDSALASGLNTHLTWQTASGSYRMRAVVQELGQGQLAALTKQVVIP